MKDYGSAKQIGHGQSYDEYLKSISEVFRLVYEKTKPTGSLWIVADTFRERSALRLLPFDIATSLKQTGWNLKDVIIWNKTKTLPWSRRGQFRRTFEYILFFAKTERYKYFIDRIKEPDDLKEWWVKYPERYSPEGKVPTAIWNVPIPVQGSWSKVSFRHFCPFPAVLVEKILMLTTEHDDCVLDPFAGSGMVLAQAKVMERKYIGCDVNKSYRRQFYRVITSHINKTWNRKKKLAEETAANREQLAVTIRKLRQVKFPKALFKEIRRVINVSELSGIRAILAKAGPVNGNSPRYCFSHMLVYLLCDLQAPVTSIELAGKKAALRPPLSKYGISAEVHAQLDSKFWASRDGCLLSGQRLYVYTEGITYHPQSEIRLGEHGEPLDLPKWKRVPPIITNVEVRQKPIRTWRCENADK